MPIYEAIVRIKTKPTDTRENADRVFQKGDVLGIKLSPAYWSPRERTNDHWQILTLDLTELEAGSLVGKSISNDPNIEPIKRRGAYLDFDKMRVSAQRTRIQAPTRESEKETLSRTDYDAVYTVRPAEN